MPIEIDFTPHKLKSLVSELERIIKKPTGQPKRLDIERLIDSLILYKNTAAVNDIPSKNSLEILASYIHMLEERSLLDTYFEAINQNPTTNITNNILDYYFNNYWDTNAKRYLLNNIHKEKLNRAGWVLWQKNRNIFFEGDVVDNLVNFTISQQYPLNSLHEKLGFELPYRLKDDVFKTLCEDKVMFSKYIRHLSLELQLELLNNEHLQKFHLAVWNITIVDYLQEAKELKKTTDDDHSLFSLARRQLKPTKNPKWLSLDDKAKEAYQEWALGSRLESFFYSDTSNERIIFWKSNLKHIDDIKEIEYKDDVAAFSIIIRDYEFIEFKDIGAVYVYKKDSVKIPRKVKDLSELKHRNMVVNPGIGTENGEGWVAHQGRIWISRINKLITEALIK